MLKFDSILMKRNVNADSSSSDESTADSFSLFYLEKTQWYKKRVHPFETADSLSFLPAVGGFVVGCFSSMKHLDVGGVRDCLRFMDEDKIVEGLRCNPTNPYMVRRGGKKWKTVLYYVQHVAKKRSLSLRRTIFYLISQYQTRLNRRYSRKFFNCLRDFTLIPSEFMTEFQLPSSDVPALVPAPVPALVPAPVRAPVPAPVLQSTQPKTKSYYTPRVIGRFTTFVEESTDPELNLSVYVINSKLPQARELFSQTLLELVMTPHVRGALLDSGRIVLASVPELPMDWVDTFVKTRSNVRCEVACVQYQALDKFFRQKTARSVVIPQRRAFVTKNIDLDVRS